VRRPPLATPAFVLFSLLAALVFVFGRRVLCVCVCVCVVRLLQSPLR
jgi:hypothetical protein